MVKNKTIIDKLFIKNKNGEKLIFDEKFDEYIKNYDINKHNINTNNKVFCLLAKKINQEFQKFYDTYVDMQLDERFYCVSEEELERIKKMGNLNIQVKWSIYMDHHEQYKLINMINKKYGKSPQTKIVVNNVESENGILTKEEIKSRTTYEKYAICYN